MKQITILPLVGFLVLFSACSLDNDNGLASVDSMNDLKVPDNFDFKTTIDIKLSVLVQNSTMVLTNVPVKLYLDYPGLSGDSVPNARFVGTFASGVDGRIEAQFRMPSMLDTVYLQTDYVGLNSIATVRVIGGFAVYNYGEDNGSFQEYISKNPQAGFFKTTINYSYLGSYNTQGVPGYLLSPRDIISKDFLDDINASLPERIRLPVGHPDYLAIGNEADIVVNEEADVWITFVHEGAGYLNAVGYYVYDQSNPPKSVLDIDRYNVIFPNASYSGSGGGLTSGDKVFLGRFPAGKSIGWFLVPNGWSGGKVSGSRLFYSQPSFNPESDLSKKQHTVLLYDAKRSVLLIGFEDIDRMNGSDEDFNDAVFYVTANPVRAIDVSRVPPLDTPGDRDSDGISDTFDDYPDDKNLAFDNFYPAKGTYGTLMVEDLWPGTGDFDFNDLVLDYNFNQISDPKNQVKQINIELKPRAIGASFRNGFGIQLPVGANTVESITGIDLKGRFVKLNPNGTEAGQPNAVIIAFEDAYDVLPYQGVGTGVNVNPGSIWVEPKSIFIKVIFSTSQTLATIGQAPYNPFLIVDGNREKEIHLVNSTPTELVDRSYFGQSKDNSDAKSGSYYKSDNNLVWMIDAPISFDYMQEKNDLIKGYLKFRSWAESSGISDSDWYLNLPGYREESLIFQK
jgi:LruC domain-containing protein